MRNMYWAVIFVLLVALSPFVGVGEARAADPAGSRYCDISIKNPQDLKARLTESLNADSTGNRALRGCKANANHFLAIWQQDFPEANLVSPQDLLRFVGELKPMTINRDAQYQSACLKLRSNRTYEAIPGCVTRDVRAGETVYAWNGKPALMSSCVNPGVVEIPPIVVTARPCVRVEFQGGTIGTPVRGAYIGRRPLPGYCTRLQVAGVGEVFYDLPEECPMVYTKVIDGHVVSVVCTWTESERLASRLLGYRATVQNVSFSFRTRQDGTNVLWLPQEALDGWTVICWDDYKGKSIAVGVSRAQFSNNVAVISYADMDRAWRAMP